MYILVLLCTAPVTLILPGQLCRRMEYLFFAAGNNSIMYLLDINVDIVIL